MAVRDSGTDGARYRTAGDYIRAVQEHALLILALTAAVALAAYLQARAEDPVYRSEAALSVTDQSRDAELLFTQSGPAQNLGPRVLAEAERIATPRVAEHAARELETAESPSELRGMVTAQVEATTGFIVIQATGGDPDVTRRVANEFAQAAADLALEEELERLDESSATLRRRLRSVRRGRGTELTRQVLVQRLAQVEALKDVAQPLLVVRVAEGRGAKLSPKPRRDALLGALLGLSIGLLLALVRHALDRRVRAAPEVQAEMGLPVLGHVHEEALGRPLIPGAAGGVDDDLEGFRVLRANLDLFDPDSPPGTLLVTSAAPGEGKTTVAMSLALVYAMAGRDTLLVECDLRRPSFAERLGIDPSPGLGEVLTSQAEPRAAVRWLPLAGEASTRNGAGISPGKPRLACIPAGSMRENPVLLLGSARFRELLAAWGEERDVIVLDSGPVLPVADTLELLPLVDRIIVCVRAGTSTREQVHALGRALEPFSGRSTGVVLTGVRTRDPSLA